MEILSLFVSPFFLILLLMYLKFRFTIDSWTNIVKAIILGAIVVLLLILSDYVFERKWHGNLKNMRRMAAYVFFGIAFASEFAKFLVLRYGFVKKRLIENPFDSIIYALFAGLGFSTIAAVLFYLGYIGTDRIHNFTLFLWTYPVATVTLAIILGFFIGVGETRKNAFIDNMVGLFLATFFNATFFFCFISSDLRLFAFTMFGFAFISVGLLSKSVSVKK
jgi:RsiW-degrading membrane proteinase PrsW (M82 family)